MHTDLKGLVICPILNNLGSFISISSRPFTYSFLDLLDIHSISPVNPCQPAPRDRFIFFVRSEPFRQVEIDEFLVLQVIQKFRVPFDPFRKPRGGAEDFEYRVECVGPRRGEREDDGGLDGGALAGGGEDRRERGPWTCGRGSGGAG